MTSRSTFARAAELEAAGRPFAVATVVAVKRPTSARPGASGIVHPDGTIEGWVGGSCAQPVVVREALRALVDGQPRLLRLSKDTPAEGRRGDGVVELVMTCHSGGTLEIYVEPHLPAPVLWVAGTTPIAGGPRHARLGGRLARLGLRSDRRPARLPGRRACRHRHGHRGARPRTAPAVVVATQGVWDEEALAAALARDVSYVGLVASPTRAAVVRAWLRDEAGDPRGAAGRAACPGRSRSGRRDCRGGRPVDPCRARPGPARDRDVRGLARSGDARRRRAGSRDPARRRRHRAARPGLRHDRGPRPRPSPRRARRGRLRVLLDGLPDQLHPRAHGVHHRVGIIERLTDPQSHGPRRTACISKAPSRSRRRARRSGPSSSIPSRSASAAPASRRSRSSTPTHFKATAKVGVGFINARFNVDMTFAELEAPDRALIKAHGQAPGSAVDATAEMHLSDGPDGTTVMDWNADVNLSGHARQRRGPADRGDGQQDDRPDIRLHASEARDVIDARPDPASRDRIRV